MQIFKKPEKIEWLFMSIIESCKNCILRINQENIFLVRFSSLCLRHKIIIKMILSNVIRCALMTIKINHEKKPLPNVSNNPSSFSFISDLTFIWKESGFYSGFIFTICGLAECPIPQIIYCHLSVLLYNLRNFKFSLLLTMKNFWVSTLL